MAENRELSVLPSAKLYLRYSSQYFKCLNDHQLKMINVFRAKSSILITFTTRSIEMIKTT